MKLTKLSALYLMGLVFSCDLFSQEYYIVQKGETLSDILFNHNIAPIYGKRGNLLKVIRLNPFLVKNSGDKLVPGTRVWLGDIKIIALDTSVPFIKKIGSAEPVEIPYRSLANQEEAIADSGSEASQEHSTFEQYSFFKLSPRASMISIKSEDDVRFGGTEISNSSKPSMGVMGEWRVVASKDLSLYLFSGIDFITFYPDTAFGLTDTSFKRISFGGGVERNINESSRIKSSIQVNQNYFMDIVTPTKVQIGELTQTEIKASYGKEIFQLGKIKSGLDLGVIAILPSSRRQYKTKMGHGFELVWSTSFLSKEMKISFLEKNFKVNGIKNKSQEVLASLNFNLGSEK